MKVKNNFNSVYSSEQIDGFLKDLCELTKSYKIRDVKKFLSEKILPLTKNRVRLGGYKVKIKFVNPLDKTQQWSGRGGQPKWLVNGILQNKFTLEDCRIE